MAPSVECRECARSIAPGRRYLLCVRTVNNTMLPTVSFTKFSVHVPQDNIDYIHGHHVNSKLATFVNLVVSSWLNFLSIAVHYKAAKMVIRLSARSP